MVYRNKSILEETEEEKRRKPQKPVDLHMFPKKRKSVGNAKLLPKVSPVVNNNVRMVKKPRNLKVRMLYIYFLN